MKLIIERDRWHRGQGHSALIRPSDNKMCCLGFLGLACGIDRDAMVGLASPLSIRFGSWPEGISPSPQGDSPLTVLLMRVNDDVSYSDPVREDQITSLMLEAGVEVEFVG